MKEIGEQQIFNTLSADTKNLAHLAYQSGRLALASRAGGLAVEDIKLKGFVSSGDLAVEHYVASKINHLFPNTILLSEEATKFPDLEYLNSNPVVILDDIDGTRWYSSGAEIWSVNLALADAGILKSAIVIQPDLGLTTFAERGIGSFFIDNEGQMRQIHTSRQIDLGKSKIGVGARMANPATRMEISKLIEVLEEKSRGVLILESSGYELSLVARGFMGGYIHPHAEPWDKAAGMLQVKEAGGIATGWPGRDNLFEPGVIAAANQEIYARLVNIIKDCGL